MPECIIARDFPHWRPVTLIDTAMSGLLREMIISRDSLTARLGVMAGSQVLVRLHAQGSGHGRIDEYQKLGVSPGRLIWQREVTLEAHGEVLVAARSVMALKDCPHWVTGLGQQALGHQLFARRTRSPDKSAVRRSPIEITHARPGFLSLPPVWGRRSLFSLGSHRRQLLVQEYFVHKDFS